ncbi:MAG TPA: 50S ribosomal protein L23 [Candidatus Nanoarchaeia archaeon]|nr:50S ribosomal protein L23 [Candidatus Nanoarchaeia archaeon]
MSDIIHHPISTEKAVKLMESENKLVFIVDKKADKKMIKEEIEKMFKIKILQINTLVDPNGRKKAYVRLSPDNPAIDVATQLGLI